MPGHEESLGEGWRLLVNAPTTSATEPDLDLFALRAFHALHVPYASRHWYFELRREQSGVSSAVCRFLEVAPGVVESPWRGSYGGLQQVAGASLGLEDMERFALGVHRHLASCGVQQADVVLPPLAYAPDETSGWLNILLRQSYQIVRHELSYARDVVDDFETRLDRGNRKQLRKAEGAGLVARDLGAADYEAAYAVIEASRRKKGHVVSMSWPDVQRMCAALPDRVRVSGVLQNETLIASAFCLVVNPSIRYVFYWGEIDGSEGWSPVTLLARYIYEECRREHVRLLDLGTSTIGGEPNHGLVRYKRHLGATASLKFVLRRTWP